MLQKLVIEVPRFATSCKFLASWGSQIDYRAGKPGRWVGEVDCILVYQQGIGLDIFWKIIDTDSI